MNEAVVVTGAAGGIGQALQSVLAEAGYLVIAVDSQPRPASMATPWLQCDLARLAADPEAASAIRAEIERVLASVPGMRLAGLVNNAAVQVVQPADSLAVDDLLRSLTVNAVAPFVLARLLMPLLARDAGCVVNIGSIHSRLTKPGFSAYSISKSALAGVTRALAVEWGDRVRITSIEPAAIATPMLEAGFASRPEAFAALAGVHPARAIGQGSQVGRWVLALLSDRNAFANGTTIRLDGGISSRLHDPD